MTPPIPPDWKCPRRVGFLFPHACRRTTPIGCPDCQNGQIADPYAMRRDRWGYDRYDYYDDDDFFALGAIYHAIDFTEADGADLVQGDTGEPFENDMTES